jgi:hypothetical protein
MIEKGVRLVDEKVAGRVAGERVFSATDRVCGKINPSVKLPPPGHSSVAQWQSIRLLTEGL